MLTQRELEIYERDGAVTVDGPLSPHELDEAEAAYREDLGLGGTLTRAQIHPDNVWSLRGLNDCLEARGASVSAEGQMIAQKLALAEARADGRVGASCYCAQAAQ